MSSTRSASQLGTWTTVAPTNGMPSRTAGCPVNTHALPNARLSRFVCGVERPASYEWDVLVTSGNGSPRREDGQQADQHAMIPQQRQYRPIRRCTGESSTGRSA